MECYLPNKPEVPKSPWEKPKVLLQSKPLVQRIEYPGYYAYRYIHIEFFTLKYCLLIITTLTSSGGCFAQNIIELQGKEEYTGSMNDTAQSYKNTNSQVQTPEDLSSSLSILEDSLDSQS